MCTIKQKTEISGTLNVSIWVHLNVILWVNDLLMAKSAKLLEVLL